MISQKKIDKTYKYFKNMKSSSVSGFGSNPFYDYDNNTNLVRLDSQNHELVVAMLDSYPELLRFVFGRFCKRIDLPCCFLRKHIDKISFENLALHMPLEESFIDEFQDKLDWAQVIGYQNLSIDFIKKHLDKIHKVYDSKIHNNKMSYERWKIMQELIAQYRELL
jgi:hypothetical protein